MQFFRPRGDNLYRMIETLSHRSLFGASIVLTLLACARAMAAPQVSIDSDRWVLRSERDGIAIYSCQVEGTSIVPFKAVMTIPADIAEISCVLEDASRRQEWIVRFGGSTLVERKSDYEQTETIRAKMPWPFVDRVAVVRELITVSDDLQTATIAGRSVSATVAPELRPLVRAEFYDSTFQMTAQSAGTKVTALIFIDPQGNLPAWAVNLFTNRVARKTLENLRRQVARKIYTVPEIKKMKLRIIQYKFFLSAH